MDRIPTVASSMFGRLVSAMFVRGAPLFPAAGWSSVAFYMFGRPLRSFRPGRLGRVARGAGALGWGVVSRGWARGMVGSLEVCSPSQQSATAALSCASCRLHAAPKRSRTGCHRARSLMPRVDAQGRLSVGTAVHLRALCPPRPRNRKGSSAPVKKRISVEELKCVPVRSNRMQRPQDCCVSPPCATPSATALPGAGGHRL